MKSILLTGGAGFIGSHTCLALLEKGYHVTALDNLSYNFDSTFVVNKIESLPTIFSPIITFDGTGYGSTGCKKTKCQ